MVARILSFTFLSKNKSNYWFLNLIIGYSCLAIEQRISVIFNKESVWTGDGHWLLFIASRFLSL